MTEDEVRELFDGVGHRPSPGFVASLRDQLADEWAQPGAVPAPVRAVPARRWRLPVGAAAVVLAVVAVAVTLQRDDRPDRVEAGPAARGTSTPAPSSTPAPAPSADPRSGVWPFTTDAEFAAYPADGPYHDADTVARAFATAYLGLGADGLHTATEVDGPRATSRISATVGEGGRTGPFARLVTELTLVQLGPTSPWTVVGARSPSIVVAELHQDLTAEQLAVRGEANAYEGTVHIEVRQDGMVAGEALARTFVTASGDSDGSLGPFQGQVTVRPDRPGAGAVVLYEPSAADGSLLRVTVVRVLFEAP